MISEQKTPEPINILRLAVVAAGGTFAVARHFSVDPARISKRMRDRFWPAEHIRPLCQLGQHHITVDQLLEYLEQARATERHKAAEAVTHGR